MARKNKTLSIVITLTSIIFLLSSISISQAEPVTARLYQSGKTMTFIELSLAPPAPATLIVEMKLPSGVDVVKTVPQFSKQNKNSIKWLLKNITARSFTIQLQTATKLDLSSSQVHIRYRSRDSGSIQEVQAHQ